MKKALVTLLALVALALPAAALAHPLGNFTVNRYSEIALSGERVYASERLLRLMFGAYELSEPL